MRTAPILTLLAVLVSMPTPAVEAGAEYQGWCNRRADSDGITANDRAAYIGRCIDELVSADRNPDLPQANSQTRDGGG